MGVERHTGALAERSNLLKRSVQVRACLGMDGDDVRPGVSERLNIVIRIDNHEVNIDHALGRRADRLHDERPNRDVRNESTVHDVDVNPIGSGLPDRLNFGLKAPKISGKNGRGDSERLWGAGHRSSQAPQRHRVNGIRSLTAIVPAKDNGKTASGGADGPG